MKRASWRRTKHPHGIEFTPPLKRKPLRKVSRAQGVRMRKYHEARIAFLAANPACGICLVRGKTPGAATEVHHIRGRNGSLLCDLRGFIPSCRACREWPHENPKEARALGVFGEAWEWGVHYKSAPEK